MTVLGDAAKTFPEASSSEAYMTAGTFRAVVETCRNLGWTKEEVRLEHIEELIARLLRSKGRFAQAFPGMRTDRYEVIAGGLTVLQAVYRTLGLREARLSQGGVRVGLLYELLGNPPYRDEREASVRDLARRLSLDTAQGERVASWAGRLLSLLVPEATDACGAICTQRLSCTNRGRRSPATTPLGSPRSSFATGRFRALLARTALKRRTFCSGRRDLSPKTRVPTNAIPSGGPFWRCASRSSFFRPAPSPPSPTCGTMNVRAR